MVYYDPSAGRFAAQRPSPLCPKCGSHRTEVVGMSKDLKKTFLRCNACGARSEVSAYDAVPLASAS
jgi:transcription elongation factor Elf1